MIRQRICDPQGGLRDEDGSSSALTAYVLIALLESGQPLTAALVNNALYCLEKASASEGPQDNPYTSALTTYALALLEHPRANESLRYLMTRATRQNDLVWWEDKSKPGSLSLSIEMTSYAVLSLVKLGGEANTMEALRAVRWMSKKRNAEGGFTSTQDTVLGLEALTKYALAMANATATAELSVLLTANELEWMFKINDENRMILSHVELPTLPTSVEVFAEGEGCVLVQVCHFYRDSHSKLLFLPIAEQPEVQQAQCKRLRGVRPIGQRGERRGSANEPGLERLLQAALGRVLEVQAARRGEVNYS